MFSNIECARLLLLDLMKWLFRLRVPRQRGRPLLPSRWAEQTSFFAIFVPPCTGKHTSGITPELLSIGAMLLISACSVSSETKMKRRFVRLLGQNNHRSKRQSPTLHFSVRRLEDYRFLAETLDPTWVLRQGVRSAQTLFREASKWPVVHGQDQAT